MVGPVFLKIFQHLAGFEPTSNVLQISRPDDFKLNREVSIYSIGDLLKETVANETLPDQRDRKYFIVTHKKRCCRPPPIFVPGISIVQVRIPEPIL